MLLGLCIVWRILVLGVPQTPLVLLHLLRACRVHSFQLCTAPLLLQLLLLHKLRLRGCLERRTSHLQSVSASNTDIIVLHTSTRDTVHSTQVHKNI